MDGAVQPIRGEFGGLAHADSGAASRSREAAFAALADPHATLMYRVAFSLLKNRQDAEDAVQETYLKLLRTDGWHRMADERAFLARSVWRVSLSKLGTAAGHGFDESAMEAAPRIQFRPAHDDQGRPVDWEGVVRIQFQMS